jgi:hypothetical protein
VQTFRIALCVALAALLQAAPAWAHITVVPPFAAAGGEVRLVLAVPNERRSEPMTSLRVTAPPGFVLKAGEPLGDWRATVSGEELRWSGGSLAPRRSARFALLAVAPRQSGAVALRAVQGYPDGGTVPWRIDLTVTPATGAPAEQHLGAAALAAVVGLAVIGGSLLVLQRLRRR